MAQQNAEGQGSATTVRRPLPDTSRYELLAKIATGGMATVYVGRQRGAAGFWRLCAIKRAHAHLVEDPAWSHALVAEARLASRIQHPNVVSVADVEELDGEILLVMDYIEGASLGDLVGAAGAAGRCVSARAALRIALDACAGLRAAHELRDDDGRPLGLVHRDISPQNLLVGADGATRLLDFGVAKCVDVQGGAKTTTGALKGKVPYMAPEYLRGRAIDARSDLFALAVVLWETLATKRLFRGETEIETMQRVMTAPVPPLAPLAPEVGGALDRVLAVALDKSPARRFATVRQFAEALEEAAAKHGLVGDRDDVAAEVEALVGAELVRRRDFIRERLAGALASEAPVASLPPLALRGQAIGAGDDAARVEASSTGTASTTIRIVPAPSGTRRVRYVAAGLAGAVAIAAALVMARHARAPARDVEAAQPSAAATALPSTAAPATSIAPPTNSAPVASAAPSTSAVGRPRSVPQRRPSSRGAPAPAARPDPNPYAGGN